MANDFITPYMLLTLPVPGLKSGPEYAIQNNEAFERIDSHSHVPGEGLAVPTAGLNIDDDLTFNEFSILELESAQYVSLDDPLDGIEDLRKTYVVDNDLYYTDGDGNVVRLTINGQVNTSGSGNIIGMDGTDASVVYTDLNKTFTFYSDLNIYAYLKIGSLSIGNSDPSPFFVNLSSSLTATEDYELTFPEEGPTADSVITTDSTGQLGFTPTIDVQAPAGSIIMYGGTSAPSGWLMCNGQAVSRSTYSRLFAVIGEAFGEGNNTTTFNVPDLRGRFPRGVDDGTGRDPNAASRTASGSGGNTGDNVGSLQDDDFESHNHTQNSHTHSFTRVQGNSGAPENAIWDTGNSDTGFALGASTDNAGNTSTDTSGTTATNNATGGSETRPKNLYVYYIIKT